MQQSHFEQARVTQLTSTYGPHEPPGTPLDVGDLLSLLWRLDACASLPGRERYYRRCAVALCHGLGLSSHPLLRFVELTPPGDLLRTLPSLVYRVTGRTVDAHDRRAACDYLLKLRIDILRLGTGHEMWVSGWPGSGIADDELRDRVFAVLFTALQGQYPNFARLLLVTDIVIANVLIGLALPPELPLSRLVAHYDYPDPSLDSTHALYFGDKP